MQPSWPSTHILATTYDSPANVAKPLGNVLNNRFVDRSRYCSGSREVRNSGRGPDSRLLRAFRYLLNDAVVLKQRRR